VFSLLPLGEIKMYIKYPTMLEAQNFTLILHDNIEHNAFCIQQI